MSYAQLPQKLDVQIIKGDNWSMLLTFKKNGIALNLTGYTLEAKLVNLNSTFTIITITNTDLVNGQVTLSLTNTQTNALSNQNYQWFMTWTVNGSKRTVVSGVFGVTSVNQPLSETTGLN